MPLVATAPEAPFRIDNLTLTFGVKFPIVPQVDEEGNPVLWTDAEGNDHVALEMGSTYIQATTVDANGQRGPQLEGNETDLDASLFVDLAALLTKHLPAFIGSIEPQGSVVGVVE